MAINRRNILLGLGAIVGGGGALIGTGAFSTVSAARTVSVSTAGDASAYIGIDGDGDYVTDMANQSGGSNELTIDLGGPSAGFNDDAITVVNGVLTITNNAADGTNALVGLSTSGVSETPSDGSGSATITLTDDSDNLAEVTFEIPNGPVELESTLTASDPSTATTDVNVTVDTSITSGTAVSNPELTIVATEPQ
ncbi:MULTISPECIES: hypothetical protein [Haloferax]|uniref:DUF1102 domain-containing protein n=1 Tax=Haloferax marinum TaxID=2666143 RepID=A0A6A8GAE6_9EURY|nr:MULTISPECIES: hypothetical protein [Haloferax]KAB1198163.1 hypothetical protein Hfx1150_11795 [Haloferax sp. CBA1150]MRW97243.1 hypothetical protein [Haloferax marinum]